MDVFLAGKDSLKMLRIARSSPIMTLVPASLDFTNANRKLDLAVLRKALPKELALFSPETPICLHLLQGDELLSSSLIEPFLGKTASLENAFLEVLPRPSRYVRIFVESPGLTVLEGARRQTAQVSSNKCTRQVAVLRILNLEMELCGLFVRDPNAPQIGDCVYNVEPLWTVKQVDQFLESARGAHGAKLARHASSHALDASGSPAETLLALAHTLPPRYGGIHLERPVLNQPLSWGKREQALLKHKRLTPDQYWDVFALAVEYNGGVHGSKPSYQEDNRRAQDYKMLKIDVLPATDEDIKTEAALSSFMLKVAIAMEEKGDIRVVHRVRAILRNENYRHARRVLLQQLLPPLTRYDDA